MDIFWKNQNMRLAVVFVFGIIIGAGSLWIIVSGSPVVSDIFIGQTTPADESEGGVATTTTLLVAEQFPGKKVVIGQINLDKSAWVAIHDYRGGKSGNVLGAKLFSPGKQSGIIELKTAMADGAIYSAIVHEYSGEKEFDYKSYYKPMQGTDGKPIMAVFAASSKD